MIESSSRLELVQGILTRLYSEFDLVVMLGFGPGKSKTECFVCERVRMHGDAFPLAIMEHVVIGALSERHGHA